MHAPVTAQLPPELEILQQKWVEAARGEQEVIYSLEFGPAFALLFAKLPLDGYRQDRPQFRALVSILGLSWQPVALMAAWAAPETILVLGTDESLSRKIGGEPVIEVIPRVSGIRSDRFTFQRVAEADELQIYREVRSFLDSHGIGYHEVAVDPTGGKKSMSVSAALAGFLSGAWIVYVDYGRYNAEKRIPDAGTEYPRLLRNPLEVFGELEFDQIKEAFRRGNYEEASHLAENLAARLYEPREAEALSLLAGTYGAWHRFNFHEASDILGKLKVRLEKFSDLGRWNWSTKILQKIRVQSDVISNLAKLESSKPVTIEEGLPLVLNHLAAAERYLSFHQFGVAILLTYATLERYLDLCLWVNHGLDDEIPDFNGLALDMTRFHQIGRELHGGKYQRLDLPNQISLSLGAQLLATLDPALLPTTNFGPIKGLMSDRNKCEFEHGLCAKALSHDGVVKHLSAVKRILTPILEAQGKTIATELERYRFPEL